MDSSTRQHIGRRTVLRWAGLAAGAAGAAAALPWPGETGPLPSATLAAAATGPDPDLLFKAGRFAAADREYARLLRKHAADATALAGRGRIALLSNRFAAAEKYLTQALRLAPDDVSATRELAQCFVRQDRLSRAVPLLRATGDPDDAAFAAQYAAVTGNPYAMRGAQRTRLPFVCVDPLPCVRAVVNGGEPQNFLIDTGATLAFATETAERAGLRAVSTSVSTPAGQTLETRHGVMPSFRLGGIELRDVPVVWYDLRMPVLPDGSRPAGVIGTTLLYHFLATMDYANQELVLRRRTAAQQRELQATVRRTGTGRLPLWLAGDHIPCTLGSVNGHGPRVASLDTGGMGLGVMMNEENARRAGVTIDYANPRDGGGMKMYPIKPATARIGDTVRRDVPGVVGAWPWLELFGFDTIANFSHEFFRPCAITFDYTGMDFYITGP
ncbi:hypothetical protein Sru01_64850 [Sphaerisporangium rufum]|uniref:Tetratricopeptide repeat protein n=1 Tax=Sphaerisporangium rufum TaxID=1381558 RepID=A0A919R957_9ACTN|nr:retropepsin-like aspartic protease [Sphaerisporangium rufum]GII81503.1 hypothetical protein Sru01_64850 [Sphaerisporangium rufum]